MPQYDFVEFLGITNCGVGASVFGIAFVSLDTSFISFQNLHPFIHLPLVALFDGALLLLIFIRATFDDSSSSSSRACLRQCTAHHHSCGRALIFIADARPHHLSAATRLGRRTVHHSCGRAHLHRGRAPSSSSPACPMTVQCPSSSMRTRTHIHCGRAPSSTSRARPGRCIAHHHSCGRALIFIADARLIIMLLPVLDGAQFIIHADALIFIADARPLPLPLRLPVPSQCNVHHHPCGRALIFIADAHPHHMSAATCLRLSILNTPFAAVHPSGQSAPLYHLPIFIYSRDLILVVSRLFPKTPHTSSDLFLAHKNFNTAL
ncbi:hypothetical protein R3P38DRAFT_3253131 [Favolaschia claudopus]|uniref:Uncharacterized protein n=1 Tax=Favolaschia claudopus TaxID=2862362 RepID=A0AAW0E371_9AGAR